MARFKKGTFKRKKTGKVARTPRRGYNVYRRWYEHYAANNAMQDPMLDYQRYKNAWLDAKESGYEMTNFSRKIAMKQREATEFQLKTTFGEVKARIKALRELPSEKLTIDQKTFLNLYGNVTLKQYRMDISAVLEKVKLTFEGTKEERKEAWDKALYLAFDSPKERKVRRTVRRKRKNAVAS